jgi:hypothetical protein
VDAPGGQEAAVDSDGGERQDDFSELSDPAFLTERARVRDALERQAVAGERADLQRVFDAMNREFDRRARIAWTQAG